MIKQALFGNDEMSPEGLAATINAAEAGIPLLRGLKKAHTSGKVNLKDPLSLASALLLAGLTTSGYSGLGALTANVGKRFDNPILSYGVGLLGGPGGVAGVVRGRE